MTRYPIIFGPAINFGPIILARSHAEMQGRSFYNCESVEVNQKSTAPLGEKSTDMVAEIVDRSAQAASTHALFFDDVEFLFIMASSPIGAIIRAQESFFRFFRLGGAYKVEKASDALG